jgi:hypothetical protein
MTYTELTNAIINYTQNDDPAFIAYIPTFVTQAEERVYNSVQIPSLRKNVTGLLSAGNQYLSCPGDFMSVFSMAIKDAPTGYEYLLNKDVNFLRASYPDPTETGTPKYYTLFGPKVVSNTTQDSLSFMFAPTPDIAYTAELHYYAYPESITVAADGTTWLSLNYSPVLLYGSLVEAYVFMKGEADIMAFYKGKYDEALAQLNRLGTGLERGDAYRDGQAKIKVNP